MNTNFVHLANAQLQYFANTNNLNSYTKDIIPGEYQGGFKLWECTLDLLRYFDTQLGLFEGKRVLEMGCGHGLLGIMGKKLGAVHVCLQDYNQDVLDRLTKATVQLNCGSEQGFSYVSGDWLSLKSQQRFDVIIGSQLIYTEDNYNKVIVFILQNLQKEGQCILANKHYYFGVGGNMPGFKKAIEKSAHLKEESLLKIIPQKGGNKKQIVKITMI